MKTIIIGLFDQVDDAERVLAQLVDSPLDLDTIQIVHSDTEVQRALSLGAGLPPRRAMRTGMFVGALLGAGLGFAAGLGSPSGAAAVLSSAGPLLAMSAGALLGALLGSVGGALSESINLPEDRAESALEAVAEGATLVSVRTSNEPTARAIGDLFVTAGSRDLGELAPLADAVSDPSASEAPALAASEAVNRQAQGVTTESSTTKGAAEIPDAHAAFAPPWRREDADPGPADILFADADTEGGQGADRSSIAAPRHGETLSSVDRTTRDFKPRELPVDGAAVPAAARQRYLSELGLSTRVVSALMRAKIDNPAALQDLVARGTAEMQSLPGIGRVAVSEILTCLAADQLRVKPKSSRRGT